MSNLLFPIKNKWDYRFMKRAEENASWSKDPRKKVGAVISYGNRIVSNGFNGFPCGFKDTDERLSDKKFKNAHTIHAEINAILFSQQPLEGCTIYVWPLPPCVPCACVIAQSGISRVVSLQIDRESSWYEPTLEGERIFDEVGISTRYVPNMKWLEKDRG